MTNGDASERRCAWCSAVAGPDDRQCPSCGAAIAQREDLGGVVIPGVTGIDPALQGLDGPMRIPGSSPTQGMAGGVAVAAAIGGPVALAALGGIAAVAAAEYLGAKRPGGQTAPDLDHLGQPSELARLALERLEHEASTPTPDALAPDPWRDEPRVAPAADPWRDEPRVAAPSADPWRDLPPAMDAGSEAPPEDPDSRP